MILYQMAFVLRSALGDCTNNGITSRAEHLYIFPENVDKEEVIKLIKQKQEEERFDLGKSNVESLDTSDEYLITREKCFRLDRSCHGYVRAVPLFPRADAEGIYTAGGNYVTGDSNFHAFVGHSYPISVHDRFESWEAYHHLSI